MARRAGLAGAIARFEEWMADPGVPGAGYSDGSQPRQGVFAEFSRSAGAAPPAKRSCRAAFASCTRTRRKTLDHAVARRHNVVVTPTASGKTLCYNLPVLQRLMDDPGARAMYLFPTKALAEDQLAEFQSAVDAVAPGVREPLRAFTYDGDTPQDARRAIRERANVVLTNPDLCCHSGIFAAPYQVGQSI